MQMSSSLEGLLTVAAAADLECIMKEIDLTLCMNLYGECIPVFRQHTALLESCLCGTLQQLLHLPGWLPAALCLINTGYPVAKWQINPSLAVAGCGCLMVALPLNSSCFPSFRWTRFVWCIYCDAFAQLWYIWFWCLLGRNEILNTKNKGPFKCYVTLFIWKLDPDPPPRNANNIEAYTFVTLISGKSDTPHPHLRYVILEWPPNECISVAILPLWQHHQGLSAARLT